MDGPKVNTKFYGKVVTDREQSMFHKLIDFGSCNLHIVHGSLKTGAKRVVGNWKKILKGSFQILHHAPSQREDYVCITGSTKYPLFFCATWWVMSYILLGRTIV